MQDGKEHVERIHQHAHEWDGYRGQSIPRTGTADIIVVRGDLLDFVGDGVIVHQGNATSRRSAGLAKQIFRRYPWANVYTQAAGIRRAMGLVMVRSAPKMSATRGDIACIIGQLRPGPPPRDDTRDTAEKRASAFRRGLKTLFADERWRVFNFPWGIGCGLAQGKWSRYKSMISEAARECGRAVLVRIVRLPE